MPQIHDLADALYKLAPWEGMLEHQLIALRHPETGRLDHISIMGQAGNHYCLALYLGPTARHRFNLMQEADYEGIQLSQEDALSLILDTQQLQASFSPRADLFKSELAEIKTLGRKYRGGNWPSFRSFKPGHSPTRTDPAETAWLATAIEQVLEVTPTIRPFEDDTLRHEADQNLILTREHIAGIWTTTWTPDDDRIFTLPTPEPDAFLLEKVRRHSRAIDIEIHFQLLPSAIGKSREDSIFPYLILCVEPRSHFVLGVNMLSAEDKSHDELIASVPTEFLRICDTHSIRPASINVASAMTAALLTPTATALDIPYKLHPHLPALDSALHSMMGAVMGGPM